jgi:hypothetical protein
MVSNLNSQITALSNGVSTHTIGLYSIAGGDGHRRTINLYLLTSARAQRIEDFFLLAAIGCKAEE